MEKPQPKSPLSDSRQSERAAEEDEVEGLEEIDLQEEEMQKTQQQNGDDTGQGGKQGQDKDTSSYDHVSDSKSSPVQHRTSGSASSISSIHRHAHYWILLICVQSLCHICISHIRIYLDSSWRTLTLHTTSSS